MSRVLGKPTLGIDGPTQWEIPFGDRRQELVFIGADMDERAIRARLDACLLDDDAHNDGPFEWALLDDPFHTWEPVEHHEHVGEA